MDMLLLSVGAVAPAAAAVLMVLLLLQRWFCCLYIALRLEKLVNVNVHDDDLRYKQTLAVRGQPRRYGKIIFTVLHGCVMIVYTIARQQHYKWHSGKCKTSWCKKS